MTHERCSWCGEAVGANDGFRGFEPEGARRAVFCRLEHVVPWVMQGAHWSAGELDAGELRDGVPSSCAQCDAPLGDMRVLLVRHRGEHRIADGFCRVQHALEWARAGGRWR